MASSWDDASWEVTEYEPPRVFACRWLGASCGAVRLLYEALGGTTRVTLSSEEAVGLFTRGPEVERAIRAQMEHDLAALKRLLEAREGGADHDDTRDHRATYQEGKDMREAGMGTRPAATRTHSLVR